MDALDTFELDAAFESIPLIEVGDCSRLRVRIHNCGDDFSEDLHVDVRADASLVLLVSGNQWLRGEPANDALSFARAPLLRGEEVEIVVDAYALRAGESTIRVRAHSAQHVRELDLRCASEGAPAFEACANRLELFASEADPGADVSGRIVLTNTGNAVARGQLCVEGLDAVQLDAGPALEIMPAQRLAVALGGRLPILPDGSQHAVRAFITHGDTESVVGTAAVTLRSRASVTCELDGRGRDWLLRVRNDGVDRATLAIGLRNDDGGGLRVEDLAPGETSVLVIAASPGGTALLASAAPAREGPERWRSRRAALEPGTVRQLRAMMGFVRHLWAIAILCADSAGDDSAVRLAAARTAMRSVFDRLAIKLRMPHYPLHADDVLDRPAREALCALGAAASGDLASMLDYAASFIAGEGEDCPGVHAYRTVLRTRLCALRDDAALIAALTGVDSELDVLLDAVLTAASISLTA